MPITPSIIMACGGSGLATLTELNKLLVEDPGWRFQAPQNIYYILVESDRNDLNKFRTNFENCYRSVEGVNYDNE